MKKYLLYTACAVFVADLLGTGQGFSKKYKNSLSEYGFFTGGTRPIATRCQCAAL